MISHDLARSLALSGLLWHPAAGDQFSIQAEELEAAVFTVSELTIEVHTYPDETILRFNGTTEWALDSVSIDQTLWLPSEEQLRALLSGTFRALRRLDSGRPADAWAREEWRYTVEILLGDTPREFTDAEPANAYAQALLALITASAEV
ncbi:hypothetical protein SAMN05216410_2765 [Sanguibacter gelidistatuariae]|uniref:Pilus assembly protein CpaE n=1 Tax=Sanguibacter gelidistatuariae TaxID=1814289 RepID=A0A1G6RUE7_9MICO|nr:pilus assembly protein CpaE [Sanguibacter gelidistatuariae]SDD07566.1 hypothetical protein SAMN05216410_2765 [Sanguibacter gelidistatuariae]